MVYSILAATPLTAFGELLRISLEDNGQYLVKLVSSGSEVLQRIGNTRYDLAILDAAIKDIPFLELCNKVLNQQDDIYLVVIPPDNNPTHPSLAGLTPHGYINRPFYLPDLYETITRLLNTKTRTVNNSEGETKSLPVWLQDTKLLTSYLEQELLPTQAISGVIGKLDQATADESILAFTGQLDFGSIRELVDLVFRFWKIDEKNDLMRFIRISSDHQDYLVYATRMPGELALIILFESSCALTKIRALTKKLAYRFSTVPPTTPANLPQMHETEPDHEITQTDDTISIEELFPSEDDRLTLPETPEQESQTGGHEPFPNLAELLGEIPEPNPVMNINSSTIKEEELTPPSMLGSDEFDIPDKTIPVIRNNPDTFHPIDDRPTQIEENQNLASTKATPSTLAQTKSTYHLEIDPLEDTRPQIITSIIKLGQLEPVSPALCQLKYTCILIPRLPNHFLSGKLADLLSQWINQISLAYGWRLTAISIRPEFVLWTVEVVPSISPGNIVRIIRQRSSLYIFNEFPQFREQNPSGDFWAAGYLIVSGAQPPSAQLLRDYIIQTRRRQGVT